MPKIELANGVLRTSTIYPGPLAGATLGREKMSLGTLANLTQFGVNLTRLKPGAASALRHWHEEEDEFVYILEGAATLIEDKGATILNAGECAGFKAGVANGHQLVNRGAQDVVYLEIGTRAFREHAHYPDDDLVFTREGKDAKFSHKNGEPY